jgi:hypothetical protein
MLFNSIPFLFFFIIVTTLYFALPHSNRWWMLLASSCFFYMAFVPAYILIIGFTIVISPLNDQIRLNASDLATLQTIFGQNRVYDFSGKNAWSENCGNYYESSYYRPLIGDSILTILYL